TARPASSQPFASTPPRESAPSQLAIALCASPVPMSPVPPRVAVRDESMDRDGIGEKARGGGRGTPPDTGPAGPAAMALRAHSAECRLSEHTVGSRVVRGYSLGAG